MSTSNVTIVGKPGNNLEKRTPAKAGIYLNGLSNPKTSGIVAIAGNDKILPGEEHMRREFTRWIDALQRTRQLNSWAQEVEQEMVSTLILSQRYQIWVLR